MADFGCTRVLGNWKPLIYAESSIRLEFPLVVKSLLGDYESKWLTVRRPEVERERIREVSKFHSDSKRDENFVIWSNVYPTEIKLKNGSLMAVNNEDVVLIDNLEVLHRRPLVPVEVDRWFVRLAPLKVGIFTEMFKDAP